MGRSYGMPEVDEDELEAELDALGDEIALDDDTSYLDDAMKAPNAPTSVPGADSVTNKVLVCWFNISHINYSVLRKNLPSLKYNSIIYSFIYL